MVYFSVTGAKHKNFIVNGYEIDNVVAINSLL